MKLKALCFSLAMVFISDMAYSHGGRLNSQGCHNDRKNGGYHCHGTTSKPKVTPSKSSRKFFKNCTQARAAGVAPIRKGEPGYAKHLDRDNDGIACEIHK